MSNKKDAKVILKRISNTSQLAKALASLPNDTEISPFGSDGAMLVYNESEGRAYIDEGFSFLSEEEMEKFMVIQQPQEDEIPADVQKTSMEKEEKMTIEERNIKLKYFITCLKCDVSGKCCDENCPTQYQAGNMGEIIENLEAISKILEQEPTTKNDLGVDCISRKAVERIINKWLSHSDSLS